jgi:hypothetical protein
MFIMRALVSGASSTPLLPDIAGCVPEEAKAF